MLDEAIYGKLQLVKPPDYGVHDAWNNEDRNDENGEVKIKTM